MCWFNRRFPMTDDDIAPMIRSHEITLELARTRGLTGMLNELQANKDSRDEMREDPQEYLANHGVTLPQNARVTFRELEADGWEIEVRVVEGLFAYVNGFNNEKGFFRIDGPQRPPKRGA